MSKLTTHKGGQFMRKILLYVFIATLSILSFKFLNANTMKHTTSSEDNDDNDSNDEDEDRTDDQF